MWCNPSAYLTPSIMAILNDNAALAAFNDLIASQIGRATTTLGLVSGYSEVNNPEKLVAAKVRAEEALGVAVQNVKDLSGYELKPETEYVTCDWSVYGESCPQAGEAAMRINLPVFSRPYYKDVVIMFIKMMAQALDQWSVSIFFDMRPNLKPCEEQPDWLPIVLSYQQPSEFHPKVILPENRNTFTWEMAIPILDVSVAHERRRQILSFLNTITGYGLTCTVQMTPTRMNLSGGLNTHFDAKRRDDFESIINERLYYLVRGAIHKPHFSFVVDAEIYYSCK